MKTKSIIQSTLLAAGFSAFALIGSAQAQIVANMDINLAAGGLSGAGTAGTYIGVGAAADSGMFWNALGIENQGVPASYTLSNLTASDGSTATGISVTVGGPGYIQASDLSGNPAPFAPALLNDFAQLNGGAVTFTLSGLTTGASYNLFLYSQNAGYNIGGGTFNIGSTSLAADNSTHGGDTSGFVNGGNYVEFSGVVDGTGIISGTVTADGPYSTNYLNGLQIVETAPAEVPEPSTVALIGLGALGLAFLVVRRRHSLI